MSPVDRYGMFALAVIAVAACAWAGEGPSAAAAPGATSAATLEGYQPEERALIERLQSADLATRLTAAGDRQTPLRVLFYLTHNDPAPEVRERAFNNMKSVRSSTDESR